jgi:excinuclease ABC subunit C
VLKNRVRPCLEYQIKRCSGPCCLDVDRKEYALWVEQAVSLLEGKTEEVICELRAELERASEELRYEDAALIRDRMQILGRIKEEKQRVLFGEGSVDALGMYREGEHAELSVLSVRQGRLFGSRTFGFSELSIPNEEFLGSLLSQLYAGEQVLPETVILPFELEDGEIREGMLSEKRGAKVELRVPQRGSKARLLLLAQRNAKENFEARFSAVDKNDRVLAALRTELELSEMPRVIDCVDISHFQGSSSVAAVVSMRDLKFEKKRYRSFYVSQEGKPDDFASIREVVSRHLSRTAEEGQAPDLMLIDGGPQQLAQAVRAREELGLLAPPFVGIAKKRLRAAPIFARYDGPALMLGKKPERLYLEGREGPVILSPQSEALQALERLRNEAHRSAITFHRKARSKKSFRSVLDDIPGIGPKRRTTILREFGSVEALKLTPPEKMAARAGIPLSLAKRISDLLKKKAG